MTTFIIKTGDPAFDPRQPVEINGYRYVPSRPAQSEEWPSMAERLNRVQAWLDNGCPYPIPEQDLHCLVAVMRDQL